MAGGVDQVELICIAIAGVIIEAHGLGFDGDAALFLDFHIIEHLLFHLALGEPAAELNQTVGQRRFPVVDMGHDGKIADIFERCCAHFIAHGGETYHPFRVSPSV